jgi:hypothetical protein
LAIGTNIPHPTIPPTSPIPFLLIHISHNTFLTTHHHSLPTLISMLHPLQILPTKCQPTFLHTSNNNNNIHTHDHLTTTETMNNMTDTTTIRTETPTIEGNDIMSLTEMLNSTSP